MRLASDPGTASGRHAGRGREYVGMALSLWMVAGLFLDGWAHAHLESTKESFFTPWHAVLYSGFVAVAGWVAAPLLQQRDKPLVQRIPDENRVTFVGVVVFAAGGAGDVIWHDLFGIEVGIAALLSPTHLVLLVGGLLMLTTPLRTAWRESAMMPKLSAFMPVLLSATLSTAVVAFFLLYAWGGTDLTPVAELPAAALDHGAPGHDQVEQALALAIIGRLVTTILLIGPLLLLLKRWKPPLGSAVILFTTVSTLLFVLSGDAGAALLVPPVAAGLLADLAIHRRQTPITRRWMYALAAWLPLVMWGVHFAAMALTHGLGWPPELWGGAIVLAALASMGMAVAVFPPPSSAAAAVALREPMTHGASLNR